MRYTILKNRSRLSSDISRLVLEIDSSGVVKATGNLEEFRKKTSQTEKEATSLDDVMNQFNISVLATSAGVAGLVKAFSGLVSGIRGVAAQSLQAYSHYEAMQKGLETFFQSAEKGKAKFDELRKFSNETTFGVDELANSFTQLANVGTDVDTITQKLTMLGNISGGNKEKFADLVSIYSKILSVGKASSMQIQQLAARGVPIYDMLKKIGVTGTATGEQITKAFEEMTKEGGQFYNAMNDINDTIEGKEGFISDYWKEMLNNFAEASGLAEVYKSVLDTVKEGMGRVVDKLFEINNNPTAKFVFQGLLVSTLTAVAGIIGGSLLSAIVALNKKLAITAMLKSVLDPKTLGIALAVAGIAGLTVAVAGLAKEWENASNAVNDYNSAVPGGGNDSESKTPLENTATQLEQAQKEYDKQLKKYLSLTDKKTSLLQSGQGKVGWAFQDEQVAESDKAYLDELEKKIKKTLVPLEEARQKVEALKESLGDLQAEKDFEDRVAVFGEKISELFDETTYAKSEKEIEELADKISGLQSEFKEFSPYIDDGAKDKVNNVLNEWQSKLSNMKIKFAVDNQNDWQKELSKILGFSNEQIAWLMQGGYTGKNAGSMYGQIQQNMSDRRNQAYGLMGFEPSQKTEAQDTVNLYKNLKNLILEISQNQNFTINDNILKELTAQLNIAKEKLKELGYSIDDAGNVIENNFIDKLKDWTDKQFSNGNFGGAVVGSLASQSGDLQNAAKGFQNGGWIGAIIETVIGALANVCQGMEGFEEVLNPVTTLFQNLSELLSFVMEIISSVLTIILAVAKIINTILKILKPVLKLIEGIIAAIASFIEMIANAIEAIASLLPWVEETKETEEENAVDLTEAYEALLSAMKDNEEEYEKRKKELNASDYANKVTGVHDMILTPQGQFSTDPDDYIIATKNPGALNNGGADSSGTNLNMNIIINNDFGGQAEVSARQIDTETMMIKFSKKIASDYASGINGWDSAVSSRAYKQNGRSLAL